MVLGMNKNELRKNGFSIVMTGFIALEGTAKLAKRFADKIDKIYPSYLSRNAKEFGGGVFNTDHEKALEASEEHLKNTGTTSGESAFVREVSEGGFLTALHEIASESGLGFEIDLRKVPILQETVEICNLLEVNPYRLYSGKCLIIMAPEGGMLADRMTGKGINAVIVGTTTDKKACILHNDGTESYLNRPEPDELTRLGLR